MKLRYKIVNGILLEYTDVAIPVAGPKDVVVQVKAAAANPLDYHFMRGSPYLMRLSSGIGRPDDPRMGADFAGIVSSVGDEVTRFAEGDRVFGGRNGAFAEFIVIPEDRAIAHLPDDVSFEAAAAIPIALGAEVHGVCSTPNVEMVLGLGAEHVFDYKKENYTESDNQYDLIVDMVGSESLSANRRVLQPNGRMVLVGGPKGDWLAPFWPPLKAAVLSMFIDQEIGMMLATLKGDDLEYLAGLMADGRLMSQIDRRFPLHETPEALRYLETQRARGKVIVSAELQ